MFVVVDVDIGFDVYFFDEYKVYIFFLGRLNSCSEGVEGKVYGV